MFDKPYEYQFRMNQYPGSSDSFLCRKIYAFDDGSNTPYLLYLEEYPHQVYTIKYFIKSQQDSENKYHLLSGKNHAGRIIGTCIKIMLDFYSDHSTTSFGFCGANLLDEPKTNTKRFRVYSRAIQTFFSPLLFDHRENEARSIYLLLSLSNKEPNLFEKVDNMFEQIYDLI